MSIFVEGIVSSELTNQPTVIANRSPFDGRSQETTQQDFVWRASVTYRPMRREEAATLLAQLKRHLNLRSTFLFGDPDFRQPLTANGAFPGTGLVQGAGQSGLSLATDGWATDGLILRADDYITVGYAQKQLYRVASDVTAAAGAATIELQSPLRGSPPDNALIETADTLIAFRVESASWPSDQNRIYRVTAQFIEAI